MLANGVIDEARHQAGCRYAFLFFAVFGRRSYAALDWDGLGRGGGMEPDDTWLEARRRELDRAEAAFASRREHDLVLGAAVYERLPRCLLPTIPTAREVAELRLLVEALGRLARAMGT